MISLILTTCFEKGMDIGNTPPLVGVGVRP
jgi:hypothetical protein